MIICIIIIIINAKAKQHCIHCTMLSFIMFIFYHCRFDINSIFVNHSPLFASLVCAVSYASLAGEKMYFRKFFKFQVTCVTFLFILLDTTPFL